MMNKYEIRTQKKKDAIIKAALSLFREKGYTKVSINEIALQSGISTVSIYNYFKNKEGLVTECTNILMKDNLEMINNLLNEKINFREKMKRVVTMCSTAPQELLGEFFTQEALEDKVLLNLYGENIDVMRKNILIDIIELGKEEGDISSSISTSTILDFIGAIANVPVSSKTDQDYSEKSFELYQLLLFGLLGK